VLYEIKALKISKTEGRANKSHDQGRKDWVTGNGVKMKILTGKDGARSYDC
jgi:hypothetical protein